MPGTVHIGHKPSSPVWLELKISKARTWTQSLPNGHCHEKEGSRSGRHHGGAPNTFCDGFNVRHKGELTTEDNLEILSLVTKKLVTPLREKANGGAAGLEKIIK